MIGDIYKDLFSYSPKWIDGLSLGMIHGSDVLRFSQRNIGG